MMRSTKTLLSASLVVLLALAGCDSAQLSGVNDLNAPADVRAGQQDATIAAIVVAAATADENEEFTLLLAALQYADLVDVFTGSRQLTVFAPTDAAFLALVTDLADDLDEDVLNEEGPFAAIDALLGPGAVASVLLYHVVPGRRTANSVVPVGPRPRSLRTLNGASISVAAPGVINGSTNITTPNVLARNGVIHIIDEVLLP
jgi:uncharacterized surface protein with fasciclin (FAS1) repeats